LTPLALRASAWWQGAVVYQIWPRSFADSDDDGIGDLPGIRSRLDYLNDGRGGGLGVDAIWLSPVFVSPLADFGYDISDYTAIDPIFGTLEDLDRLISECHERRMRVLLDLVPNHTSDLHPWFLESRSSRENLKRSWYRWRNPAPDGGPPNNWRSAFSAVGPAWTLDPMTGQYYHHSYTASQPDLNWDNHEVREAMLDVVRFWFDRGVDGFRIDVAHRLGKDPRYRDNPPAAALDIEPTGAGRHDADWPSGLAYLREIRSVADEYDERLLVGEVYVLDQNRVIQYLMDGDGLHLSHNFVFLNEAWSARELGRSITSFEQACDPQVVEPAWCLNNHDHSRVRSRFDFDGRGVERARSAAALLLGLRGTIFLYQGEELGLPDSEISPDSVADVDGRDPARSPIPWAAPSDTGPGAGFSEGIPWLPVGSTAEEVNVASQLGDPESMLELYRRLIRIRRSTDALKKGRYREILSDDQVLVFERRAGENVVVVAVNFSTNEVPLDLPDTFDEVEALISSQSEMEPGAPLQPLETRWLHVVPQKTTESLASGQVIT
jgi:alpha-glucosidase